jgi:hypothetical protein
MIHARPLDGLTFLVAAPHRLEKTTIDLYLNVAVHARFRGWESSEGTVFHRGVAITAIESQFPDMKFMAIWNWLGSRQSDFRHIGRTDNAGGNDGQSSQKKNDCSDAGAS